MRLDLCAVAFGLLLFSGSSQNWAQEQENESQTKPSAAAADSTPTEKPPTKYTDEDMATEFRRLSGIWRPESAVLAGEKLPAEVCERIQLELSTGKFNTMTNGIESSGTIVLDLAKEPRAMDITIEDGPEAGKTIKCVYKLDEDKLHVAYSLTFDDVRPTQFDSNQDNKQLLIVYKRPDKAANPSDPSAATPESPRDK